jgi:hypothetical protein
MESNLCFDVSLRMPTARSRARLARACHFSISLLRGMARSCRGSGVMGIQFLARLRLARLLVSPLPYLLPHRPVAAVFRRVPHRIRLD